MNLTEIKALVKKRQENLKAEGRTVKLGHLYEEYAHEQGFKNWAVCKAKVSRHPKTFKDTLESIFLEEQADAWANKYYNYGLGDQIVFQLEVWQDNSEWQFCQNEFPYGTGGHTRDYFDSKGPKFCVHIESSSGFDPEFSYPEENLDHYFTQYFGTGISKELKDWVTEVQRQERTLHNTWELENLIHNADSIDEVEAVRQPMNGAYLEDVINDMIEEKFS